MKVERDKAARQAREIELAPPVGLSRERQISLSADMSKKLSYRRERAGTLVPRDKDDANTRARITPTTRPLKKRTKLGA